MNNKDKHIQYIIALEHQLIELSNDKKNWIKSNRKYFQIEVEK